MTFPQFNTQTVSSDSALLQVFNRFQGQISAFVNAINAKPQLDTIALTNINLVIGQNQIPHTLGNTLVGWSLMDIQIASPKLVRYAPSNKTTLFLTSDVVCTVSLLVW